MLACAGAGDDRIHCPTKWELWRSLLAKLPSGRAWQNPEVVNDRFVTGMTSEVGEYETGHTGLGAEPSIENLTVMQQWWAAFAGLLEFVHQRACALLPEFFCSTTTEMRADWGVEFGFPDPCEPYPDLCAKVTARGGSTLQFLRDIAAANLGPGIVIDDKSTAPELDPNELRIRIPGEPTPQQQIIPFAADALVVDCTSPCRPIEANAICLIERFRQAHVKPIYEVV